MTPAPSSPANPPLIKFSPTVLSLTGHTLTRADVVARCLDAGAANTQAGGLPITNSGSYAEVSRQWLDGFQTRYTKDLAQFGVGDGVNNPGHSWSTSFDCVYFVHSFITFAQLEYHRDVTALKVDNPSTALAILWVEYMRDTDLRAARATGKPFENHAITLILTDKGAVFWDPQVGPLTLSSAELASIYLRIG